MTHPTILAANVTAVAEWLADNGYTDIASLEAANYALLPDVDVQLVDPADLHRLAELTGKPVNDDPRYDLLTLHFDVHGVAVKAYTGRPAKAEHVTTRATGATL